jgi:hypothetical protein
MHSAMLEQLSEGLAANSSEAVAAHLGVVLAVEASASGSLDVAPESLVATSRMEDGIHISTGEPYLGY